MATKSKESGSEQAGRQPSGAGKRLRTFGSLMLLVVVAFAAYFLLYTRWRADLVSRHHLRLLASTGEYASDAIEGAWQNVKTASLAADPEAKRELIPGFEKRTDTKGLEAFQDGNTPTIALDSAPGKPLIVLIARSKKAGAFSWQISLEELLAPTLPQGFFDKVVIARSDGEVLLQSGNAPISFQRLKLSTGKPPLPGQQSTQAIVTIPEDAPSSQVLDVTVAGAVYKAFLMPFPLPHPVHDAGGKPGESESHWYVAGFLSSEKYRAMSMALPPDIILTAISLFLLGLLSLPFLRIVFMGVREELRHIDIVALTLATIVGCSLATFVTLYFSASDELRAGTETNLKELSNRISSGLRKELVSLEEVLGPLTERLQHAGKLSGGNLLGGDSGRRWAGYPFFEMAILMDPNGEQVKKQSIRNETTALSKYPDRAYFRKARNGLLWKGSEKDSPRFLDGRYVESIRSKATGQEFAMLSRRMQADPNTPVAVVQSRLLSVISPVLPPGTAFAIVDDSGLVQFHSDPARNVRENFFDELGSDEVIRGAVTARQELCCVRTTYRTVPSVIHAAPIDGTPWTLLVFEDATESRLWIVEVTSFSLALYACYLAALFVLGALAYRFRRDGRYAGEPRELWYWPRRENRPIYLGLLALLVLVALLWIPFLLLSAGATVPILLASFVVPLASGGILQAVLRRRVPRVPHDRGDPLVFSLLMAAVAVVLGVVPVLGFFQVVLDEDSLLLTAARQVSFAEALRTRRIEKLKWYEEIDIGGGLDAIWKNIRGASDQPGFYTPGNWTWELNDAAQEETLRAPCSPLRRPVVLSLFAGSGLAAPSHPIPESGGPAWLDCEGKLTLFRTAPMGFVGSNQEGPPPKLDLLTVQSPLSHPILAGTLAASWFWILGILWLLLLCWFVHKAVRCVFLADYASPRALDGAAILERQLGTGAHGPGRLENAILLRFRLNPEYRIQFHEIGSEEVRTVERVEQLIEGWRESGKEKLLLGHFDYGLRDPEIIEKNLRLIERLNDVQPRPSLILIESSVDPLYILTARFQDRYDNRASLGISLDRWSAALHRYARLRTDPDYGRDRFADEVSSALAGRKPGEKPIDPEVRDALIEEGHPNRQLRQQALYLAASEEIGGFTPRDVVDNMLDLGQALYRRIWTSCSTEEKVLLYRIAKEGFVNRKACDVLRPLQRRGLVLKDPSCRIMNESFRRFILTAELPEVFWKWERRGVESAWARMRAPLLIAFAAFAVFFFATQREAFSRSLTILAAVTAVAPALLRLFTLTINRDER